MEVPLIYLLVTRSESINSAKKHGTKPPIAYMQNSPIGLGMVLPGTAGIGVLNHEPGENKDPGGEIWGTGVVTGIPEELRQFGRGLLYSFLNDTLVSRTKIKFCVVCIPFTYNYMCCTLILRKKNINVATCICKESSI